MATLRDSWNMMRDKAATGFERAAQGLRGGPVPATPVDAPRLTGPVASGPAPAAPSMAQRAGEAVRAQAGKAASAASDAWSWARQTAPGEALQQGVRSLRNRINPAQTDFFVNSQGVARDQLRQPRSVGSLSPEAREFLGGPNVKPTEVRMDAASGVRTATPEEIKAANSKPGLMERTKTLRGAARSAGSAVRRGFGPVGATLGALGAAEQFEQGNAKGGVDAATIGTSSLIAPFLGPVATAGLVKLRDAAVEPVVRAGDWVARATGLRSGRPILEEQNPNNRSLIPPEEQERLLAKYGGKAPASTGLRSAGASPIDNPAVDVPSGTGVVRNNMTGREFTVGTPTQPAAAPRMVSASERDRLMGFEQSPEQRGLRRPDGIFGFMSQMGALTTKARDEQNAENRRRNEELMGLRRERNDIEAAKLISSDRIARARLQHDMNKDTRDAGMKNAEALNKQLDRLFITTDADGKQIEDKASRADFERKAEFTLARMAADEEARTGKKVEPRNLRQLAPEELQELYTWYQGSKNVQAQRGGLRDFFGTSQVNSDDLRMSLPQSVESGLLGDTITLKSGETVSPEDFRGGGFNLFGPNDPTNADLLRLEKAARQRKE